MQSATALHTSIYISLQLPCAATPTPPGGEVQEGKGRECVKGRRYRDKYVSQGANVWMVEGKEENSKLEEHLQASNDSKSKCIIMNKRSSETGQEACEWIKE